MKKFFIFFPYVFLRIESPRDNEKILCRQFSNFKKISARKRAEVLTEYLRNEIILCLHNLSKRSTPLERSSQPHIKRIREKRYLSGKESIARSSCIAIENSLVCAFSPKATKPLNGYDGYSHWLLYRLNRLCPIALYFACNPSAFFRRLLIQPSLFFDYKIMRRFRAALS